MMSEDIGFGVNGFSVRDPFAPLIDSGGLEAAVQAYERRWGPSSDGGRAQVEYIIVAYLSASASLVAAAPDKDAEGQCPRINMGIGKMSQYEAGSLNDIAQMFERFAASAEDQAKHRPTKIGKQFELGRASAWRDAAQMLRKTTLEATA